MFEDLLGELSIYTYALLAIETKSGEQYSNNTTGTRTTDTVTKISILRLGAPEHGSCMNQEKER